MKKSFSGQFFFHYFFGVVLSKVETKSKEKEHETEHVLGEREGTKMLIKNAIKGVNKRIFFVFSIIIFNNVLLQLPIFYQTIQRMFYSFHL